MSPNDEWNRLPTEPGIYAMRNAQNHQDTQEIKVVLAVLSQGGGLTELNVYDGIGEIQGYYGEYKKLRPFDLSKKEQIAKEDLDSTIITI